MIKPLGLSEETLAQIEKTLRQSLSAKKSAQIFAFGSRATGGYRQYSDLDLWLESVPPLSESEIAEISAAFDDSDLSIKIDVVSPETCFKEYQESILKNRKLWLSI